MRHKTSAKIKILSALESGKSFTTTQLQNKARVANVSARISELREDGNAIYCNSKKNKNGEVMRTYRLGNPRSSGNFNYRYGGRKAA